VAFLARLRKVVQAPASQARFSAFLSIEGRRAGGFRNAFVTSNTSLCQDRNPEMTPLKSFLLTVVMISGLAAWGAGIYSADASANHVAVDGYGVTTAVR
jgi:hypothetical protein